MLVFLLCLIEIVHYVVVILRYLRPSVEIRGCRQFSLALRERGKTVNVAFDCAQFGLSDIWSVSTILLKL